MTDKKRLLTYTYNIDYLLFLYSNDGYANAPKLYVYTYIACLFSDISVFLCRVVFVYVRISLFGAEITYTV